MRATAGRGRGRGTGTGRGTDRVTTTSRSPSAKKPIPAAAAPASPSIVGAGTPKKMTSARVDRYAVAQTLSTDKRTKTALGASYDRGEVPCRIDHGSVRSTLMWTVPLEELRYDPLFVLCAEGLVETTHPLVFIARQGLREMVRAPGAREKVVPLVDRVAPYVRTALRSQNLDVFGAAAEFLCDLVTLVGAQPLTKHVDSLLMPLRARMSDKTCGQRALSCLSALAESGGPEMVRIIKAKIPTFSFC